jgi:hypothetical protein
MTNLKLKSSADSISSESLHIMQKLGSSLLASAGPPSSCGMLSVKPLSTSSETFCKALALAFAGLAK